MNKLTYIIMPLLTIIYIGINLYLVSIGSPLCQTSGCDATKTLFSFNEKFLYYLGLLATTSLLLIGIFYLKLKENKYLKYLFIIGLTSMVIVETILLSYLYFETKTICILCAIFYILIIINLFCIKIQEKKWFLNPILIILFTFIIYTFFISIFLLKNPYLSKTASIQKGYTLLTSDKCKYCKETKNKLNNLNIEYKEIDFVEYKEIFKILDLKTIPVLISKEEKEIKIIEGKNNILNIFNKEQNEINFKTSTFLMKTSSPFQLKEVSEKEGCSIELSEKEGCSIELYEKSN